MKNFFRVRPAKFVGLCLTVVCFGGVFASPVTAAEIDSSDVKPEPMIEFFAREPQNSVLIPQKTVKEWLVIKGYSVYDPNYRSQLEKPFTRACPSEHPICSLLVSSRRAYHGKKVSQIEIKTEKVRHFLKELTDDFGEEPIDARLVIKNGRATIFTPSKNGYRLNVEESLKVIERHAPAMARGIFPKKIKLSIETLKPKITTDADAQRLGIVELLAEGRSNFAGSPPNRIHNIRVAANRFNGVILAPGEELSFVDILGPVNGATGYRKELVIINNQTRPEYGGGVCQVSTTLFRAAILAGLEITQRRSHSYAVRYYEPIGFDATIYIPNPDLKFRNNTPRHILIQNFIEGTELVFRIYGTSDGRTVEMEGPFVTAYNSDGSPKKAHFTRLVKDAQGNIMFDETFHSNYKSPRDYPKPADIARTTVLTEKPADWSKKQWRAYKKAAAKNRR